MNKRSSEQEKNDEINLYVYWEVLVKRKWLLFGAIAFFVALATVYSLMSPKIYRSEFILKMATNDFTDIIDKFNKSDTERLKFLFPKTYLNVEGISLNVLEDPALRKLKIFIDVRDTSKVQPIIMELMEYINSFPYYKRSVEQARDLLQKQMDELTKAIINSEEMLSTYNLLLGNEKLVPLGFNPIESYNGILDLKTRRIVIEQSLKKHIGTEIISQDSLSEPVKPRITKNILIAMLLGFVVGIFMIFFIELTEKKESGV